MIASCDGIENPLCRVSAENVGGADGADTPPACQGTNLKWEIVMATFTSSFIYAGGFTDGTNTEYNTGSNPFSETTITATGTVPGTTFTLGETIDLSANPFGVTTATYEGMTTDGTGWIGHSTEFGDFLFTDAASLPPVVPTDSDPFTPPCFTRGTMILTPDGEQPVEALCPGQLVVTQVDGVAIPRAVKWIGHRRIDLTRHPRAEIMAPIRIERDAFADNVPHRDLLVSQDHAIFVDGVLICAKQLVNGTTIRRERDWTAVDYYHVELDQHAILLAEGLPAESYLNTGNSGFFANSGQPMVLHPDLTDQTAYPTREANSCAPFVTDEASVRPVWERLAERAATIGRPIPQRMTTTDADLRIMAKGQTVRPIYGDDRLVIFALPRDAKEVRLVSRAASPTEARPWLSDQRKLGVRVARLVLRSADEAREVPMDHPDLVNGWWAVEHNGQAITRWTDGAAVLPMPKVRGLAMLEVHLSGAMTYAVDATPDEGAERRAA